MSTDTVSPAPEAPAEEITIWNKIAFWLPHLVILAYCGVIGAAFSIQIIGNEMPCPLCMLQRMDMVLIGIGALWIIGLTRKGELDLYAYVRAYGLMMFGAGAGLMMSGRQIELHILPGDPGYGEAVFGLHLYTWAFVTFAVVLVYTAVMLMLSKQLLPKMPAGNATLWITRIVGIIFILVIIANVISVFFEEGFALYLPDDPTGYNLFTQLGF